MKRYVKSLSIAALALIPAIASAQSSSNPRQFSLGVSGGASFPTGDLGVGTETGYSIAGHIYLLPPKLPNIGFRGDVAYDRWGFSGLAGGSLVDGNARVLGITGNIMLKVSAPASVFHPYLIAGAGGFNSKFSAAGFTSNGQTKFGIQGGAGFEFGLSGFTTFIEAKYVNVFVNDNNEGSTDGGANSGSNFRYIPLTFGIRF
ncbi:MAG: outer membrane beta-barrel protein [Gemmatimonadaceae bacterium]